MYRLLPIAKRLTPGQLRRRADRRDRRAGVTRLSTRPSPIVVNLPAPAWNESYVQKKVEKLQRAMSQFYGWRAIRTATHNLREHLIAVAKARGIERCQYRQPALRGQVYLPDVCGGRIRQRRRWVDEARVTERFCDACGRVAA